VSFRERVLGALESDRVPFVCAALAFVLGLPALGGGYFLDDVAHRVALDPSWREHASVRGDWDIFRFASERDPRSVEYAMERGLWPWWVGPGFRLAFLRPLSSLWHAFDYRFLAKWPWLLHLENVALHAALALVAAFLLRELVKDRAAAGLAALLYAVDDAHATPIAWIGTRNTLLASAFGLAAVWLFARSARTGRGAWASVLATGLGLASGEAVIGCVGLLAAWAFWLDPRGRRRALVALAPHAALVCLHAAIYVALGYGARGSAMYVDPLRDPVAYGSALLVRAPVLAAAALFVPPSDVVAFLSPRGTAILAAVDAGILAGLGLAAFGRLRRAPESLALAVGGGLALLPVAATMPGDRLLLVPSLAAMGLVAIVLASVLREPAGGRAIGAVLALVHVVIAPLLLPLRVLSVGQTFGTLLRRADATLPLAGAGEEIVILDAPDMLTPMFAFGLRHLEGRPVPDYTRQLAVAIRGEVRVARKDERTIDVTLTEGFFHDALAPVFRSAPYRVGDAFEVAGFRAEVIVARPDGRADTVRFRFDRPLGDRSMHLVVWEGKKGFVPFVPPKVGEEVTLPAIDPMEAFAAD